MEAGAGPGHARRDRWRRSPRRLLGVSRLGLATGDARRQPASQRPSSSPLAPCRGGAPSPMQIRIEQANGLVQPSAEDDTAPVRAPPSCRGGAAACRPRARAFTTGPGGGGIGDGISFPVRAGLILSRPMGFVRLGMDGPGMLEPGAVGLGLRQVTAQFSQPICLREARSLLPCRVPLRRDHPGGSPPASSWRG